MVDSSLVGLGKDRDGKKSIVHASEGTEDNFNKRIIYESKRNWLGLEKSAVLAMRVPLLPIGPKEPREGITNKPKPGESSCPLCSMMGVGTWEIGGDFAPQGSFGNVWKHFGLS